MASPQRSARRADAERSIAAILEAAVEVLGERPEASMAEIAGAAGVTRQTVYAHYDSRQALLRAVTDRAMAQTVAAIDAAEPAKGSPIEALDRLIAAWWQTTIGRRPRVLEALAAVFHGAEELHDLHSPILERVERLIRRGQRAGDFDRRLPVGWLSATFLATFHAAAEQVAAGRIDSEDALRALERTIPRMFGVGG